ncbi:MAG: 30S ribosomal protein S20 [Lachnospiraceae bacterium]|nr:30S ribosomal protein S20 [Lachnospiraceae bacterium]
MEVYDLANIKSAEKRILVTRVRTERNKAIRSGVKTAMKKVFTAVEANDKTAAEAALKAAIKEVEMAQTKGIYHKNNAARKVSRLTKAVNSIS